MSKQPALTPRDFPEGIGFYAPQATFAQATEAFLQDLFAAERRAHEHAATHSALSAMLGATGTDIERFSMAVQLFAVFTIEAALASYGVLRFGEVAFNDTIRWQRLPDRIDTLFADRPATAKLSELQSLVRKLADRRDRIVHPLSGEYEHASDGTTLRRPAIAPPDTSPEAAVAVFRGMRRALELLRAIDSSIAGTFAVPFEAFRRLPELDARPNEEL